MLSSHQILQLLDEEMTEAEQVELEEAQQICSRFLAWDLTAQLQDKVGTKERLAEILGSQSEHCEE